MTDLLATAADTAVQSVQSLLPLPTAAAPTTDALSPTLNAVPLITLQPPASFSASAPDATAPTALQAPSTLQAPSASATLSRSDSNAFSQSAGGIVLLAGIAVLIFILIVAILIYSYFRVQSYQREKRRELRKRVRFNEELANLPLSIEDEDDYGSSGNNNKAATFVKDSSHGGSSNPATVDTTSPYAEQDAGESAGGGGWSWLQIWTNRQAVYNARGYTEVRDMAPIPGYSSPYYSGSSKRPQGGGARIDSFTSSLRTKTTRSQSGNDMGTLTSSALSQLEAQRSQPHHQRSPRANTHNSLYTDVMPESAKSEDTESDNPFSTLHNIENPFETTPSNAGDLRSNITITTVTTSSNPASGVSGTSASSYGDSLYTPSSVTTPTITRLGLAGSRMSMSPSPNNAAAFLKAKAQFRSEDGSEWSETSSVNWKEEEIEVSEYSWAAKSDGSKGSTAFSTLLREYEGGSFTEDDGGGTRKN
ncbi:hypothetical protein HK096_002600 [Nowakowskiella sp. JEL0078]|nr:hypothetical protein HK096_002600 [Nowakowskiella sp. JEL0078]